MLLSEVWSPITQTSWGLSGDKPVLVVMLSWEISIKQQQNILGRKIQNTQQSSKIWLNKAEHCEDS